MWPEQGGKLARHGSGRRARRGEFHGNEMPIFGVNLERPPFSPWRFLEKPGQRLGDLRAGFLLRGPLYGIAQGDVPVLRVLAQFEFLELDTLETP